jgi:hypothetical protein
VLTGQRKAPMLWATLGHDLDRLLTDPQEWIAARLDRCERRRERASSPEEPCEAATRIVSVCGCPSQPDRIPFYY